MPLASGIELPERYRVTRHIASGGMASVWEVEDLLLGRVVAVKVLGAQYAADRGARARFQREARTAARVSEHAHIATIYDTGEHGDDTYIVMEYFSGGTVADRLRAARDGGAPRRPRDRPALAARGRGRPRRRPRGGDRAPRRQAGQPPASTPTTGSPSATSGSPASPTTRT